MSTTHRVPPVLLWTTLAETKLFLSTKRKPVQRSSLGVPAVSDLTCIGAGRAQMISPPTRHGYSSSHAHSWDLDFINTQIVSGCRPEPSCIASDDECKKLTGTHVNVFLYSLTRTAYREDSVPDHPTAVGKYADYHKSYKA
ncbi:unnamed protein product [Somion occarium]|uniref:Uncharacterized protein n=1 Tax=Somion occarium TaxID=3059160 RepID=A0ABP1E2C5_9APHY